MKHVIIGSNGFVGKSILRSLKDDSNSQVIGISRSEIDLLSEISTEKIKHFVKEGDNIIFCAAEAPVKNLKMFTSNIKMLNNFLFSLDHIKLNKLIYLSSDAVYSDSTNSINEEAETNPDNLHGIMHLTRERIIKSIFPDNHLIVRPTLIYGYGDPHNGYGPNKFINTSINEKKIQLFGEGEELRDHICIDDLSKMFKELIVNDEKGTFNLVSGDLISFFEIAEVIINLASDHNIQVDLEYKKRTTPMPHNGFRKLSNKKFLNMFPKINISSFNKNIDNYFKKCFLENIE
jgi:UDP-glucose 4-epimerase